MKILLLCLHGFETMEFSPFIDVMGWARDELHIDITVDTCGYHQVVESCFGVNILVNKVIDDINVDDYDALAIPGGFQEYGFYEEGYHEKTLTLIQNFHTRHKVIATVCVAAFLLAKSGVLVGKKATTYHLQGGYKLQELQACDVQVVHEPMVVDGNIITSSCPHSAAYVAFALLEKFVEKEMAHHIRKMMGY